MRLRFVSARGWIMALLLTACAGSDGVTDAAPPVTRDVSDESKALDVAADGGDDDRPSLSDRAPDDQTVVTDDVSGDRGGDVSVAPDVSIAPDVVVTPDTPVAVDVPAVRDVPVTPDVRDDTPVSLEVAPPATVLRVTDIARPMMVALTATVRARDGRTLAVTPLWSAEPPGVVTVDAAGVVRTTNLRGGDAVITARAGSLAATASVRVVFDIASTPDGRPADMAAFSPTATLANDAARTPAWVYPSNGTVFPQNMYKVLFQWRPSGNDRFRIAFESDAARVTLYTNGTHPTCMGAGTGLGCFEPTQAVWRWIAASNPRGTVRVTLDGARAADPTRFYRAGTLSLGFSRGPVPGAIYYWSTTVEGVRRATVSDEAPTNFLTPPEADRQCVACHTLSRRGNRLVAVVQNSMWVTEVSATRPPPRIFTRYMGRAIPMSWGTFSTDETRVLGARDGVMTLRDSTTGAPINTVTLAARTFATQPDWAPDNSLVAFVMSADDRDRGPRAARIATIPVLPGDRWGTATALYPTGTFTGTASFPSFSWDSQWLAFVRSANNGQNDVTSDLWLMRRDGSAARALTRANTEINNAAVTTATVQDNMPTWAPSGLADDYAWVAFSSTRDWGAVLSGASRYGRHEQIWVAAIDLVRAAAGPTVEPSFPAFRLPFQGLDEDTHRPFWAIDRARIACTMTGLACATDTECCAGLTCSAGTCRPPCSSFGGRCATSSECCTPGVCLSGICGAPCRPAGGACATNADCCGTGVCAAGVCTPGACRSAGERCALDADCCAGGTCSAGLCVRPVCAPVGSVCSASLACCAPSTCVSGVCRAPCRAVGAACTADGDCCAPASCSGGVCRLPCVPMDAACTASAECCTPGACMGGTCRPPCRAAGAMCATNADCCAPTTCVSGTCRGACTMSGGMCGSDSDCCAPDRCTAGVCRPPCRPTATACTSNADCCSGTCTRGLCAAPPCVTTGRACTTSADCCSGTCVAGGCAPG